MGLSLAFISFLLGTIASALGQKCFNGYAKASFSSEHCYSPARNVLNPGYRLVYSLPSAVYACAQDYTGLVQPKTKAEQNWLAQVVIDGQLSMQTQNGVPPEPFPPSVYVAAANLAGYWAWFDNSTFPEDQWCHGHRPSPTRFACAILRFPQGEPPCFDAVPDCNKKNLQLDLRLTSGDEFYTGWAQFVCQQDLAATDCPPGFFGLPGSGDCYHLAKRLDLTNWVDGFCQCYAHSAYLSDIPTFQEAIFIAGLARYLTREEMSGSTQFLIGITALYPLGEWRWTNGWPVYNYTQMFWEGQRLPVNPPPGSHLPPGTGNQCASIAWRQDEQSGMFPQLSMIRCTSGKMSPVCKLTPDTRHGRFPPAVQSLAAEICPR